MNWISLIQSCFIFLYERIVQCVVIPSTSIKLNLEVKCISQLLTTITFQTGNNEWSSCHWGTGSHHVCPNKWTTQTHDLLVGPLTLSNYINIPTWNIKRAFSVSQTMTNHAWLHGLLQNLKLYSICQRKSGLNVYCLTISRLTKLPNGEKE